MVAKKEEIQTYIKARSTIGCSYKHFFSEISVVYGSTYDTVRTRRWKKNLILGKSRSKMHPSQYASLHFWRNCIKSKKQMLKEMKEMLGILYAI